MRLRNRIRTAWARFWMQFAGLSPMSRLAMGMAAWYAPPYLGRHHLADLNSKGFYISPRATVCHNRLQLGPNVFIDDGVIIYGVRNGGPVELGKGVHIHREVIIQTGDNGSLTIGSGTHIQPRCIFSGFKGSIVIGNGVDIAPNCAFYSYDHGIAPGENIRNQPLQSKGGIIIEDGAWLGFGVIVMDGVKIGRGAVIGAGAVVTTDIPEGAIAAGVPARVMKMRAYLRKDNG